MATSKPTAFGASIVTSAPNGGNLATHMPQGHLDSPVLTPVPSFDGSIPPEYPDKRVPVHSPFYEHPPASHEFSHSRTSSQAKTAGVYEKDVESGYLTPVDARDVNPFTSQVSVDCNKECKMWPSRQTLQQKQQEQKRLRRQNRGCTACAPLRNRWSALTKRQKLMVKLATALLIVGIAVALGVGISVAVHGNVYSSSGASKPIPDPKHP